MKEEQKEAKTVDMNGNEVTSQEQQEQNVLQEMFDFLTSPKSALDMAAFFEAQNIEKPTQENVLFFNAGAGAVVAHLLKIVKPMIQQK